MAAIPVPILPAIQLKRILYTTDFSDASRIALPVVSAISRKYGSQVYVVNVCSHSPLSTPGAMETVHDRQEQEAKSEIVRLLQTSDLEELRTTALVTSGDPADKIRQIVEDQRIDLAIISTHGRTGFKRLLMGSVAEVLLHTLKCPIVTVGPNLGSRFRDFKEIREILCPTDLSPESRAVFPCLAAFAAEYKTRIVALHVLQPVDKGGPDEKGRERLREEMRAVFFPQIDPRCQLDVIIADGDRVEKILETAKAMHADLISFGVREAGKMMLTHFRETVTYKVVLEAECPVLTFRGLATAEAKQVGKGEI
jgi:nucleotide-binding universal stress UspA family protein